MLRHKFKNERSCWGARANILLPTNPRVLANAKTKFWISFPSRVQRHTRTLARRDIGLRIVPKAHWKRFYGILIWKIECLARMSYCRNWFLKHLSFDILLETSMWHVPYEVELHDCCRILHPLMLSADTILCIFAPLNVNILDFCRCFSCSNTDSIKCVELKLLLWAWNDI